MISIELAFLFPCHVIGYIVKYLGTHVCEALGDAVVCWIHLYVDIICVMWR